MTGPRTTKTWQHIVNIDHVKHSEPTEFQREIYINFKDTLKSFPLSPWVVDYSCDSSVAGTPSDGVDRWSVFSDIVGNTSGNAHSWIVLTQAGMNGLQICIDFDNGDLSNWSIIMSVNGDFSGGTTLNRPTSSDDIVCVSINDSGIETSDTYLHAMMSDDGACTRVIMANNTAVGGYFSLETLKDPVDNWTTPYMGFFSAGTGDPQDSLNYSVIRNFTRSVGSAKFPAGGLENALTMTMEGYQDRALGENDEGTVYPVSQNELSNTFDMYPVGIFCHKKPSRGRHGELFDLYAVGDAAGSGQLIASSDTSIQWAVFNSLCFPWNEEIVKM